ncbi:hypothetical protein LEP1GSC021_2683 [Leptospira noguchii str. 1993005606]|uniref:Uncharacterized protein n=1 Tax=Leptospira noguchii str. 2007001578 TaxID=1049974 RepID=A0ABN0J0N8_9LEPT|nr:hypothetical protein LEP1GSC035_2317 [Leptospira noguchii str. 2007001578]EPE85311.1 hypothetical protein LEP1GSC021_2683 [Leptospira noguchii str. 1993005606]
MVINKTVSINRVHETEKSPFFNNSILIGYTVYVDQRKRKQFQIWTYSEFFL